MDEYEAWVAALAVPYRAKAAYWSLFHAGWDALDAVRAGLGHESADVRLYCCRYFDHYLTPETLDDLIGLLDDPDPGVKCAILHTLACDRCKEGDCLACDRCKEGDCRPDQGKVLPAALELLAFDPSPHVRAMAIECVGAWVHVSLDAERALTQAASSDGAPAVRKKAGWFAPGGTVHARIRPKPTPTAETRPPRERVGPN